MTESQIGKILFGKMLTLLSGALEGPCSKIGMYFCKDGIQFYAYSEDGNHIQNKTFLILDREQLLYAIIWIKKNCKVVASTMAYYYIPKDEETEEQEQI